MTNTTATSGGSPEREGRSEIQKDSLSRGKEIIKMGSSARLESLGIDDFFNEGSGVTLLHYIASGVHPVNALIRKMPFEERIPFSKALREGRNQALQLTFEEGYREMGEIEVERIGNTETPRFKDPDLDSAVGKAFNGSTQSLGVMLEQMGDTRATRTLRIIDHLAQVRLLQALIQERKTVLIRENSDLDDYQMKLMEHQVDDHLAAAGMLLMRDASSRVNAVADEIEAKIKSAK